MLKYRNSTPVLYLKLVLYFQKLFLSVTFEKPSTFDSSVRCETNLQKLHFARIPNHLQQQAVVHIFVEYLQARFRVVGRG